MFSRHPFIDHPIHGSINRAVNTLITGEEERGAGGGFAQGSIKMIDFRQQIFFRNGALAETPHMAGSENKLR